MKNIHVLPTDKEPVKGDLLLRHIWKDTSNECISWWRYKDTIVIDDVLQYTTLNGSFRDITSSFKVQNIYITSDETAYPYALHYQKEVLKIRAVGENSRELYHDKGFSYPDQCKKIILTTDQDLINDGVQAIDDEFLEWFVKNPSCEEVNIRSKYISQLNKPSIQIYKIIIPKEEPKQETLEEAALKYASEKLRRIIIPYKEFNANVAEYVGFTNGAKWQQERMYSEEDMEKYSDYCWNLSNDNRYKSPLSPKEWFEQFKNK